MFHFKHVWLFLFLFLIGCEEEALIFDNPIDPQNPSYIPPQITLTQSPSPDEVVNSAEILFSWEGNEAGMLYQYSIDNYISGWLTENFINITHLDEGDHSFSIQSKYTNEDTSDIINLNFIVDAVKGPSIMFFPRKHKAYVGQKIQFDVIAEEVDSLVGASFKFTYDNSSVAIDSIVVGEFIENNQESIFFKEISSNEASVNVISAILSDNNSSFAGSKSIASIYISVLSNKTSELKFDGTETFRTLNNELIDIKSSINAIVETN